MVFSVLAQLAARLMAGPVACALVVAACHHGAAPPDPPNCAAVADHVRSLLDPGAPRASRIHDAFAERCEADGWDEDARSCVVATVSLRKPRHCKARLTAEQRGALDRALAEVDAAPASGPLPSVCREYGSLIGKLGGCNALPDAMRGALELAFRDLTQAWVRGTYDTGGLELQCRAMIDGLRQAMAARCGW